MHRGKSELTSANFSMDTGNSASAVMSSLYFVARPAASYFVFAMALSAARDSSLRFATLPTIF